MKRRLQKKLLKKATKGQSSAALQIQLSDGAKLFALECWRIQKLLPEFKGDNRIPVLTSSVEKLLRALADSGIDIEDPENTEFRDGMTYEVAQWEETPSLARGKRIISETLGPAIYVKNKLIQPAKVIVSVGTGGD